MKNIKRQESRVRLLFIRRRQRNFWTRLVDCAPFNCSRARPATRRVLGQPSENYPAVDKCDGISPNLLRFTRSTKLFKGESDNRFAPVHRHIAEFLGAGHLARPIEDGLPAQRVISLMTGEDGIVVTEMRGLSA